MDGYQRLSGPDDPDVSVDHIISVFRVEERNRARNHQEAGVKKS
jgi:hypothetical protein